ncbi:hypothetical protein HUJ04_012389 [Dendroctonus ponderosae]|nr:hypothetical protein HUJ04_012389 [Dendroctonus ponderosae]
MLSVHELIVKQTARNLNYLASITRNGNDKVMLNFPKAALYHSLRIGLHSKSSPEPEEDVVNILPLGV